MCSTHLRSRWASSHNCQLGMWSHGTVLSARIPTGRSILDSSSYQSIAMEHALRLHVSKL